MNIEIINSTKNKISKKEITETVKEFLDKYQIGEVGVGIHIVGKKKIQELNRKFRKIGRETDVLSFPQVKSLKELKKSKIPIQSLGDIFICFEVCQKQAKENNNTTEKEMLFLIVHGLKHLVGIHHKE